MSPEVTPQPTSRPDSRRPRLGAGALAALGEAVFYNTVSERSQLFGKTFVRDEAGSRRLALTFDDGPNDPHTLRLLDVLAKYEVKATFFMIGRFVAARPGIARAVAQAGHAVGNHTFTHPNLFFASRSQVARELDECEKALADAVGEHARLFRPPWGFRRPATLRAAARRGLATVMWSVSAQDWKLKTAEAIEQAAAAQITGGEVILLHDGRHWQMGADCATTIAAAERLIARYSGQGYSFVTVPEMMSNSRTAEGKPAA